MDTPSLGHLGLWRHQVRESGPGRRRAPAHPEYGSARRPPVAAHRSHPPSTPRGPVDADHTTHTRRGLPAPKPSTSPHGESLPQA
ncbi:hypothetical protein STXM2123_3259 [Streptomyces sp. F-3]|nr:hypothetical protein STXM2123_3259 [Streptomyces sp. F-3]